VADPSDVLSEEDDEDDEEGVKVVLEKKKQMLAALEDEDGDEDESGGGGEKGGRWGGGLGLGITNKTQEKMSRNQKKQKQRRLLEKKVTRGEVLSVRRRELVEAARLVFADVSPEFASLGPVKTNLFEAWRSKFPQEYASAYVSESLPLLLEPFALVELAEWDLLWVGAGPGGAAAAGGGRQGPSSSLANAVKRADQDAAEEAEEEEGGGCAMADDDNGGGSGPSAAAAAAAASSASASFFHADNCVFPLTDLTWIGELADFAEEKDDEDGDNTAVASGGEASAALAKEKEKEGKVSTDNNDASLVPRMVALSVVPRVAQILQGPAYDPYSSSMTRCLVGCVGELLEFELDPAKDLPALLAAPLVSLESAVRHLCVPLASIGGFASNGSSSGSECMFGSVGADVMVAQVCCGLKLLRNASAWAALCDPTALAGLAVGGLLASKLAPALLHLLRLGPEAERHARTLALVHLPQALPPDPAGVGWKPALRAGAPVLAALVEALAQQQQLPTEAGSENGDLALLRSRLLLV
jgi:hypothetical protein